MSEPGKSSGVGKPMYPNIYGTLIPFPVRAPEEPARPARRHHRTIRPSRGVSDPATCTPLVLVRPPSRRNENSSPMVPCAGRESSRSTAPWGRRSPAAVVLLVVAYTAVVGLIAARLAAALGWGASLVVVGAIHLLLALATRTAAVEGTRTGQPRTTGQEHKLLEHGPA